MDKLIFQTWLVAFVFLFVTGPFVIWRSQKLVKKVSARVPDWVTTDRSDFFIFLGPQANGWYKILTGKYADLDRDLRASCRVFRVWFILYLVSFFVALAGQIYFIFSGGVVTH